MSSIRCGLIVNPVAGLGGEAGLKGSDGSEIQAASIAKGAQPRAPEKAVRALRHARTLIDGELELITGAGPLGEDVARRAGLVPSIVYRPKGEVTTAGDTQALAAALVDKAPDILLFAGGDGTARDLCEVVGTSILVLGIPAGVKMHSGVFAITPEDLGPILRSVSEGKSSSELVEVVDNDEDARRAGKLRTRLYGEMRIPSAAKGIQRGKRSSVASEAALLQGIAAEISERMLPGRSIVFGPGTTVQAVGAELGLQLSLLGVDVVRDGAVLGLDVDAAQLNALIGEQDFIVVVSPIGGQGIIFGRGNQQIDFSSVGTAGPV